MALTDWTKYMNQGWNLIINVSTPIVSSGTGRFTPAPLGSGLSFANIVVTNLSGRTKGVIRGKMRSLFRYSSTSGSAQGRFGFTFLQSNENLGSSTGNHYMCGYDHPTGRIILTRTTNGNLFAGVNTPALIQSTIVTPGINTVFALEVEWVVDVTELGGVAIFARFGYMTDFSDLTQQFVYLDTSSPFITSVAESVFIHTSDTGGPWNLDFDQTSLFIP